ncbi:helix-turn-helix domain-containing protein [Catelliglobosispora koreensis]|uniref:helix-turn-helix domain-containing protein n=1 Tax=Catelliglobosispora koreensis TaxID=129052 RepID=UPI00037DCA01|nr:helix-turn-helix transcriptional regulator [Catelliglobosispora koreensis]
MANERLREALMKANLSETDLGDLVGVDPKTVQRWITKDRLPHRRIAAQAALRLQVELTWLWPQFQPARSQDVAEVQAFYPHRAAVPKRHWLELLRGANDHIGLLAYASLFLPEENPEAIEILKAKAAGGTRVQILLGDPDSPEVELRGREEQLFDAIPARVRMALAYYQPLVDWPGIEFHLHRTTLYNSIFVFDDQMLVNQHIYGAYGYIAPILHLRRVDGADLFDTYARSFRRVWDESYPYQSYQATD